MENEKVLLRMISSPGNFPIWRKWNAHRSN